MKYTARMNPKENYDRVVFMMCPCRVILGKIRTILVRGSDHGAGYACVGQGAYKKCLYLPLNSAVNLKLPEKIKSLTKGEKVSQIWGG